MSNATKYHFLCRSNSDIDHVIPVIDALINADVSVSDISYTNLLLRKNYQIKNTKRIKYIEKKGVPLGNSVSGHLVYSFLLECYNFFSNRATRSSSLFLRKNLTRLSAVFLRSLEAGQKKLSSAFLEKIAQDRKSKHLILGDFGGRIIQLPGFVKCKEASSVKLISLPHGFFPMLTNDDLLPFKPEPKHYYHHLDWVFLINQFDKWIYETKGIEPSKLIVAGSARYSDKWVKQLDQFAERTSLPSAKNKVKVAYLLEADAPVGPDKTLTLDHAACMEISEYLMKQDQFEVIFQLHPNSASHRQLEYFTGPAQKFLAANTIETGEIINWADIVIGTYSTILAHPILSGKKVLVPGYTSPFKTIYQEEAYPQSVEDFDAFKSALDQQIKEVEDNLPPSKDEELARQKFIQDFITNNEQDAAGAIAKEIINIGNDHLNQKSNL